MSTSYKMRDNEGLYFVTLTVAGWVDVFSRREYRDFILENLKFCQKSKGLNIHAWVVMTNHLHLIISASQSPTLTDILRDFKKYTGREMKSRLDNEKESRREWMLRLFSWYGRMNPSNKEFQFWVAGSHPIPLYSNEVMQQKLDYIHNNPVRAGFVEQPEHWIYSSARDYQGIKGILEISFIE